MEDTAKSLLENGQLIHSSFFYYVAGGLCVAIVALVVYIRHIHSKHDLSEKENIKALTEIATKNSIVVENNSKLLEANIKKNDAIFELIDRITK